MTVFKTNTAKEDFMWLQTRKIYTLSSLVHNGGDGGGGGGGGGSMEGQCVCGEGGWV